MSGQRKCARGQAPSEVACPQWCIADREHQGDETQRWHYSACTELPLVELARRSDEADVPLVDTALSFDVALERPWGSLITYVLLGVGSESARTFCLTLESAERLAAAVEDAIRIGRGCA